MRQGRDEVEESLAVFESLPALEADQLGGVARASVESSTRDLGQVLGRVVDADHLETGLTQFALVRPRREKQDVSDRSADRDLLRAQRPRQHYRVGEENTSPRPQEASPLGQHTTPVR